MKEFRKSENGLFICEECDKTYMKKADLSYHISHNHNGVKEYYNKWIKEEDDDKCKICGKNTEFKGLKGYKNCCSKKCSNQYIQIQTEKGCRRIYGVKCPLQINKIREKGKQTRLEKYGDENYTNREQAKQTCLEKYSVENPAKSEQIKEKTKQIKKEKYGDENYCNIEKMKHTKQEKYGYEFFTNREKCKQTKRERYNDEFYTNRKKAKQTCLNKYGFEYPSQNINIHNKGLKDRLLIHQFRDTDIWYQSSYELDFLEKYYDKYLNICRGPSIKYKIKGKNKIYHSDFCIPSKNLIVEIKNSYLANKDKDEIKAKKNAVISNGFNYIIIVNKNYNKFNDYLLLCPDILRPIATA